MLKKITVVLNPTENKGFTRLSQFMNRKYISLTFFDTQCVKHQSPSN